MDCIRAEILALGLVRDRATEVSDLKLAEHRLIQIDDGFGKIIDGLSGAAPSGVVDFLRSYQREAATQARLTTNKIIRMQNGVANADNNNHSTKSNDNKPCRDVRAKFASFFGVKSKRYTISDDAQRVVGGSGL